MARYRRQYTLDPSTVSLIDDHAKRYFHGNSSAAIEDLLKAGREKQREETRRGFAYAAVGLVALLVILVF